LLLAALIGVFVARNWKKIPVPPELPKPFVASLKFITAADLARLPLATRFDSPIGTEHGAMTYNAQFMGEWNQDFGGCHTGDDLNGIGGYDTDLGDPVFAAADGMVVFAASAGGAWGNVVIIAHAIENRGARQCVQSYYAHMLGIAVSRGEIVRRGQRVGSIGKADGRYFAHLHFELRAFPTTHIGAGYRQTL